MLKSRYLFRFTGFIVSVFLAIFILGCADGETASIPEQNTEAEIIVTEEKTSEVDSAEPAPEIPGDYLEVPLVFSSLPAVDISSEESALVASDKAIFWPGLETMTTEDLDNLGEGIPIPMGTVLPLNGKIVNKNAEWHDLFEFQGGWNWFYPTVVDGVEGLTWGADLKGFNLSDDELTLLTWLYKRPEKSEIFTVQNGNREIPPAIQSHLVENRIAFEAVNSNEYRLNMYYPDDLIALYQRAVRDRAQTVFLSTDLYIHSLHLVFDRYLTDMEESRFFPKLKDLTESFREKTTALQAADDGNSPRYSETLALTKTYFDVASLLLAMAPEGIKDPQSGLIDYEVTNYESLTASYPENVRAEADLILEQGGFAESPNFKYLEDYSQFKPRGHYTKNPVLESYFRAMMWYGRLHFVMGRSDTRNLSGEQVTELGSYPAAEGKITARSGDESALLLTPAALLINRIATDDISLMNSWRELFDPITYLIGISDDLNFDDIVPVMDLVNWDDFPGWVAEDENVTAYLDKAGKILRGPRIAGNSVFLAPSEGNLEPLPGYRLFGQRFTFDSFIHHLLSAPRMMTAENSRDRVSGLEIMAVLGSQRAYELLEPEFPLYDGRMKETIDSLREYTAADNPEVLEGTFYGKYLTLLGDIAAFEQGAGFYFTHKPAWNTKALLTSHAAWAELRHDTILYVKQAYGEKAGGGDMEPTYRTVPYQRPIHYIEPNGSFFQSMESLLEDMVAKLGKYDLMPAEWYEKYISLLDLTRDSGTIAEKEIRDRPIDPRMNEFIVEVPNKLARIILPPGSSPATYADNPDDLKMALVADVFTNAEQGTVLELATGIPYRMHVALVDGHGGRRIATAYTFSYYEFYNPMTERLNDDEWKARVYEPEADLTKYLPPWAPEVF